MPQACGRPHHYAFEHGLAADQGLFATLERRQKLHGHKKAQECSPKLHVYWMILRSFENQRFKSITQRKEVG